jgi:transcriptional regulator with XRE-family HTH domain
MTPVNLSKIFKKSTIDAKLLEKISKKLNIPITYFFDSEQIVDVLEDPEEKYIDDKKKCPNCIQLQKFIDSLERHIKRLELDLEECRGDTGKQKQAS